MRGPSATLRLFILLGWVLSSGRARAIQPGDIVAAVPNGPSSLGSILRVDPSSGAQEMLAEGGLVQQPQGLLWDEPGLTLFVSNQGIGPQTTHNGNLIRIDVTTGAQTAIAIGPETPSDFNLRDPVGFDRAADGTFWLADMTAGCGGALFQIDPNPGLSLDARHTRIYTECDQISGNELLGRDVLVTQDQKVLFLAQRTDLQSRIFLHDPSTGVTTTHVSFSQCPEMESALSFLFDGAPATDGVVLVMTSLRGIVRVDLDDKTCALVPTGPPEGNQGLAVEADGDYVVGEGAIIERWPDEGGPSEVIATLPAPNAHLLLVPHASLRPGDALVTSLGASQRLVRVDPASGAQSLVLSGLLVPWSGLATPASGGIVASRDAAQPPDVAQIDLATGLGSVVTSGGSLAAPRALAVEAPADVGVLGDLVVADAGAASLFRVDPDEGTQSLAAQGGFVAGPMGVAIETDGSIFTTDGSDLVRVDPTDGSQTVVCSGLGSPAALVVGTSGEIFVADGTSIVRATPGDCATTLTSAGSLVDPVDLDVQADGDLLVADAGPPASVIHVEVPSGVQSVLASGGFLSAPAAIAVVPQSVVVVHPGDDPVSVPMLSGLATPGGLEVTVDATEGGPLTAEYDTKTPTEINACVVTGDCPPLDFAVPGGAEVQLWEIAFQGLFQGVATLVFRYDESLLGGGSEDALDVYHFVKGAWKRLTALARNAAADTITVGVPEEDGFSPFALGLVPACQDGDDNDGDMLVDLADGGCTEAEDHSEAFDCADGMNNDADGLVDHPADPGCTSASDPSENDPNRVCDDGDDDDGDELPDYRSDPGCRDALWFKENPQCDDGADNDGDGKIDWDGTPPDPQCTTAWRNKERAGGCGLGFEVVLLLPPLLWMQRRRGRV